MVGRRPAARRGGNAMNDAPESVLPAATNRLRPSSDDAVGAGRQFGVGPLARAAAFVHTLLVVELLLLATTVPGLVPLVLLDRDASNVPLAAACALPLGPAVSA